MSAPVAAASTSSKTKKVAASKPKAKSHPTYLAMAEEAIKQQNEKHGSSRIAILNYIASTYSIDKKQANNGLKNALKSGVESGALKQTKGVGANGSFKIGDGAKKEAQKEAKKEARKAAAAAKPKADKPKAAAKPRTPKPKKVADATAPAAAAGAKKRGRPAGAGKKSTGGKASAAKPDAEF